VGRGDTYHISKGGRQAYAAQCEPFTRTALHPGKRMAAGQVWLIETRHGNGAGNDRNPAQGQAHQQKEETGNGWAGVGWRRSSSANKNSVLREEYRREYQYLSIEIQPIFFHFRGFCARITPALAPPHLYSPHYCNTSARLFAHYTTPPP